jgi:hypothetical protein
MPNVNGSMFKNNQKQKKKVNPIVALIFVAVLALLLIGLQYFLLDVQTEIYKQQQLESSQAAE